MHNVCAPLSGCLLYTNPHPGICDVCQSALPVDLLLYFIFFGSVMVLSDCYSWDNEQFGHARLGDPRRTRRLVSLASSLAQHAGLSIVKSSHSTAQVESAYRLIRNPSVSPEAIA